MLELDYLFGTKNPLVIENNEYLTLSESRGIDCDSNPSLPYWINNTTYYGRVKETFGEDLPTPNTLNNILEIGCACGDTTLELKELYPLSTIIAIDSNSINLSRAKTEGSKLSFYHGDGYYPLNFCKSKSQDAVFMMNNLAHATDKFRNEELSSILNNIYQVINVGGVLLISGDSHYVIAKKEIKCFNIVKYNHTGPSFPQIPKNMEKLAKMITQLNPFIQYEY